MKDIRHLTQEERKEVFSLLKPIGYKDGDKLCQCEVYTFNNRKQILRELKIEKSDPSN